MKDFKLMNIKGTTDYLPEEQVIRNKIIDTLKHTFELYSFMPLETPMLCYYDLLSSKYAGGSEILKEVYSLHDQGDRHIGLRYDLTVPFCKVIGLNKGMNLPFRRYEIGKVFRDGPVKLGRVREFYQCDVDVCGISGQEIEFEFLSMAKEGYDKLGIDTYLEWNNRKYLSGLIMESGFEKDDINRVILSVDKLAKIGKDGVKKELEEYYIDSEKLDKLFQYFDKSFDEVKSIFKDTENTKLIEGISEITRLNELINSSDIKDACRFTPWLARGLDIYTGFVMEAFDSEQRITSSLGGGGRYDNIITKFMDDGNEYPAVGISFGLEPIYVVLKQKENKTSLSNVYVYAFDNNKISFEIANTLRKNNIKTIVECQNIKLKKALNFANRENIKYVVIIGEDEIKENVVLLKNMETSEQKKVRVEQLSKEIKSENGL